MNRRDFRKSMAPIPSGLATVLGMVFLYAGPLMIRGSSGQGTARALGVLELLPTAFVHPAALPIIVLSVMIPCLVLLMGGRPSVSMKMICTGGILVSLAGAFFFAYLSPKADQAMEIKPNMLYLGACGAVAVGLFLIGLFLLITERGGSQEFLGCIFLVLALIPVYTAGVLYFAPEEIKDLMPLLKQPLVSMQKEFILMGGPVVAGAAGIFWGGLLLYRRPRSSYYYD